MAELIARVSAGLTIRSTVGSRALSRTTPSWKAGALPTFPSSVVPYSWPRAGPDGTHGDPVDCLDDRCKTRATLLGGLTGERDVIS